ncbi:hypothetical protein BB560_006854 [Smittium megazygosporum]|uniref:Dicer-like protein 1 n=1 Tax=Smittium megazygosporum TaxID=133381 RepID=A0A2T9Y0V6_9FUNG|nr:hypothetical protein BB560_006854 [Smittium megazygosporum]
MLDKKPSFQNERTDRTNSETSAQESDSDLIEKLFDNAESLRLNANPEDLVFFSKGLIPRSYQIQMFLKAIHHNSIISLDTGTGKTLIAAMVLEFYGLKESSKNNKRKLDLESDKKQLSFFLCNNSFLVEQQATFLRNNSTRTISIHKSGGKHTGYSKDDWKIAFDSTEVHVMTHQLLLNCLRSAYLSLEKVKLLIFDECHHSRKDSPYNRIMREFYDFLSPETRPRVIGLTASPSNASEDSHISVMNLELNLDSNFHTVNYDPDLEKVQGEITYDVIQYDTEYRRNDSTIQNFTSTISDIEGLEKIQDSILNSSAELGVLGGHTILASIYLILLKLATTSLSFRRKKLVITSKGTNLDDMDELSIFSQIPESSFYHLLSLSKKSFYIFHSESSNIYSNQQFESSLPSKGAIEDISTGNLSFLLDPNSRIPETETSSKWAEMKNSIHPKVNALLEYLCKNKEGFIQNSTQETKAIIFVRKRSTAFILAHFLSFFDEFSFIKCEPCISDRSSSNSGVPELLKSFFYSKKDFLFKKTTSVLNRFKNNKLNLLIATQVAEEGLDVADCNLVIRFDPALTLTSFIQARGRARSKKSTFAVMVIRESTVDDKNMDMIGKPKLNDEIGYDAKNYNISRDHPTVDYYKMLLQSEHILKDAYNYALFSETSTPVLQDSQKLIHAKLSHEIKSNPVDIQISPELIKPMKVESLVVLSEENKKYLAHSATQIAAVSHVGSIDQMYFRIDSTGAILTTQSSPSVLNTFFQTFYKPGPGESAFSTTYEVLGFDLHRFVITFPPNPVVSMVCGPWSKIKKVARKSALFFCCIALYYYGGINENLVSGISRVSSSKYTDALLLNNVQCRELLNIINVTNPTGFFNPLRFSSNKYLENLFKTDSNTLGVETPKASSKIPKMDIPQLAGKEISRILQSQYKSAEIEKSMTGNFTLRYPAINPKAWDSPKTQNFDKTSALGKQVNEFYETYSYVVNLDYGSEFFNFSSTLNPSQDSSTGLQILFFFSEPLPPNINIPLYLNKSHIPCYYSFDQLNVLHSEVLLNQGNFTSSSNVSLNKVLLSSKQWEQMVSFTSSLISLINQAEYRLDPQSSPFVIGIPSDNLKHKLYNYYQSNKSCGAEPFSPENELSINKSPVLELHKSVVLSKEQDVDWQFMWNFVHKPNRLPENISSKYFKKLENHFLISDSDNFRITEYLDCLTGMNCNNTAVQIFRKLNNLLENHKKSNRYKANEQFQKECTRMIQKLDHLKFKLRQISPNSKLVRLLDYLYNNSFVYYDLHFSELIESDLFYSHRVNYKLDYLSPGSEKLSAEELYDSNSKTAVFETQSKSTKSTIHQLKLMSQKINSSKNETNTNNIHNPSPLPLPSSENQQPDKKKELDEKTLNKIEFKRFMTFVGKLKMFITISKLASILPWTKKQFLQLTVIPSIINRLHTVLIQSEFLKEVKISLSSIKPNSGSFHLAQSKEDISYQGILNPDTGDCRVFQQDTGQIESTLDMSALLDLPSEFQRSPNLDLEKENGHLRSINEDIYMETNLSNHPEFNINPEWLTRVALTHQAAAEDINYQRLELLGDAVLKVLITTQLYSGLIPILSQEGILTYYEGLLVNNDFLAKVSRNIGACFAVKSYKTSTKKWFPPGNGWIRSGYQFPKHISYNSNPWSFIRGCPNIKYNISRFKEYYNDERCLCPSESKCVETSAIESKSETLNSGGDLGDKKIKNKSALDTALKGKSVSQKSNISGLRRSKSSISFKDTFIGSFSGFGKKRTFCLEYEDTLKHSFSDATTIKLKLCEKYRRLHPIENYVYFYAFRPKELKPEEPIHKQHTVLRLTKITSVEMVLKTQADVIESLLGASYRVGGMDAAYTTCKAMGLASEKWAGWGDIYKGYVENLSDIAVIQYREKLQLWYDTSTRSNYGLNTSGLGLEYKVAKLESILGYKFKDPLILLEAITHSSVSNSVFCNERLEFLGDAVLGLIISEYYFNILDDRKPLSVHIITLLKHVAVSNAVFALIAHMFNLDSFLSLGNALLENQILEYKKSINNAVILWRKQPTRKKKPKMSATRLSFLDDCSKKSDTFIDTNPQTVNTQSYGNGFETNNQNLFENIDDLPHELWKAAEPPKVLGDLIESIIGGVFVDSGFSIDTTKSVVNKIVLPFIKAYISPQLISLNPIIHIGILVQSTGCANFVYKTFTVSQLLLDKKFFQMVQNLNELVENKSSFRDDESDYKNTLEELGKSKGIDLSTLDSDNYISLVVFHDSVILGYGYATTSKMSKNFAAEDAVNRWVTPNSITVELVKGNCNCGSKRDFDIASAYNFLVKGQRRQGLELERLFVPSEPLQSSACHLVDLEISFQSWNTVSLYLYRSSFYRILSHYLSLLFLPQQPLRLLISDKETLQLLNIWVIIYAGYILQLL